MLPLRIVILSEDHLVRTGLMSILSEVTSIEVLSAINLHELDPQILDVFQPDVLLVPLRSNTLNVLTLVADLSDLGYPFVIMVEEDSELLSRLALNNQISIVSASAESETIAAALHAVVHGLVVKPLMTSLNAPFGPSDSFEVLTAREQDVLQLIATGLTNRAIGQVLGIKESTVKFHVNSILTKLGAQSRTEAVSLASRLGWLIM
jgi:DNA-binding NarL/FixJ family response regulator